MFLRGKPDIPTVSIPVTDEHGATTVLEISTDLIVKYVNGFKPVAEYLPVEIDDYGFFVIDGKKLERHNARSSRTGKLLQALLLHKGELVDNDDLKKALSIPGKDVLDRAFRDLKHQLGQDGYQLDCFRIRYQGIVLRGIVKQQ